MTSTSDEKYKWTDWFFLVLGILIAVCGCIMMGVSIYMSYWLGVGGGVVVIAIGLMALYLSNISNPGLKKKWFFE